MLGEDYVPATTRAGGFRGLQAESSVRTGGTLSPDPRSASGEIAVMGEGSRMYPGLPQGRRNNGFTAVQVAAARVVDPAQTERMPGRIRVDLEVVDGVDVRRRWLEHPRTERHDTIMGGREVLDPQVEVDLLLGCAVRPVGRDMVGRQLNTDLRFAVDHHHVPVVLGVDRAVEHAGPEGALRPEICGVEHDDLTIDPHPRQPFPWSGVDRSLIQEASRSYFTPSALRMERQHAGLPHPDRPGHQQGGNHVEKRYTRSDRSPQSRRRGSV